MLTNRTFSLTAAHRNPAFACLPVAEGDTVLMSAEYDADFTSPHAVEFGRHLAGQGLELHMEHYGTEYSRFTVRAKFGAEPWRAWLLHSAKHGAMRFVCGHASVRAALSAERARPRPCPMRTSTHGSRWVGAAVSSSALPAEPHPLKIDVALSEMSGGAMTLCYHGEWRLCHG